jgi:hypothetical protein
VPASARFYVEHFGFRPRLELDWFTTLTHEDRPYELGLLRADHEVVPEGYRQRITSNPLDDWAPTLALTPGSTFPLTLIWVRGGSAVGPEPPSDLRRALGTASGTWSSSTLATAGFLNAWPDARVVGTTTYLTWIRDGGAMVADNQTGRFVSHRFNTPAIPFGRPRVGISAGIVFAGWTTTVNRTFVAARVGGVWSGAYASPAGLPRSQRLVGLAPNAGKATAVNLSINSRLYATTET